MRRRLLALVDRKANKISKKMLQLVLDDAISFLRSSGRIQPELVSRDIITAEWLVRRDPSDAKPAKKLDTLSIQYRVVAGMGPSYIHRSITDTYRNGFGSCIVSLKYTPQDEPPAGDFPEFVPLTWGKKSKLDWLDDEDEEAVKNGYTIADHRRTIRWLEYIVNAVYSMNLPQGWTVMDVFERAQAFDTGGASQTRLELMTTMIGRRPGYLPPTTPMGVARHFGATRAYLFVKTSYKFASDDKGVSPFSLLSAKSGRWLTGINFDLDEEVMDTIKVRELLYNDLTPADILRSTPRSRPSQKRAAISLRPSTCQHGRRRSLNKSKLSSFTGATCAHSSVMARIKRCM